MAKYPVIDARFAGILVLWWVVCICISWFVPWDETILSIITTNLYSTGVYDSDGFFSIIWAISSILNYYMLMPYLTLTLVYSVYISDERENPNHIWNWKWVRSASFAGIVSAILGSLAGIIVSGKFAIFELLFWGGVLLLQNNIQSKFNATGTELSKQL